MNSLAVEPSGMSADNPEGSWHDDQPKDNGQDAIAKLKQWIDVPNIALIENAIDDETLQKMGERVYREYEIDDNSRADWKAKTKDAMDLALQVAKEKQFPWPKSANIIYPLVTTASMQFAARAYPAIVNGRNVVRGVVVGADNGTPAIDPRTRQPVMQQGPNGQPVPVFIVQPGEKRMRADQIGEHMSWQLLDEMPEWEEETDRLLHLLPIVGCVFRKTYFDPSKGRNVSLLVSPMKFVVNYHAKALETMPRGTEELEYYPHEIEEFERVKLWRKPQNPYGMAEGAENGDDDHPHVFLEQHRRWDLDEDGYAEPYIVTIHKESRFVVRVVALYDEDSIHLKRSGGVAKIDPIQYYTKYDFIPNPDGGIYSLGFGQLLRPINEAINATLNQLVDAGTLQNAGGGFIGKGLSMNSGAIRFQLGEYKVVNTTGQNVRDNIIPLDFKGPSPVLFELLSFLVEAGKEIASIKDILSGEQQQANVPATTTLALIEQGLKSFTAIYKRVHRSLKDEFEKLYRLNRIYGDEQSQYKAGDTWKTITKEDYTRGSAIEPYSDPTMVSDMQRMGRAQYLGSFANDPYCDGKEIRRRMLAAADIDGIDKILLPNGPPPNPEIIAKGLELEIKGRDMEAQAMERQAKIGLIKAQEVAAYASGIKLLAEADSTVGDQHIQWLDKVLRVWEAQHEAQTQPTTNADGSQGQPGEGPPPPQLSHPLAPKIPQQGNSDDLLEKADPDGNGRVSPSAGFAATQQ